MPPRPYLLAETNYKHLQDATVDLAILPWGATEAHNYHLPYATDNIEAEGIATEAARQAWERGARIMVLPTIPFGINTGQADIFLDINLNPTTQLAILDDIAATLNRQGIKKTARLQRPRRQQLQGAAQGARTTLPGDVLLYLRLVSGPR